MPIPKFNFLRDEPATRQSGNFFSFYHETIAPALKKILQDKTSPHTIGLFGSWGTGKSTVIEILREDIGETIPFFVFDAWKYQNDSLRRIFLLKLKSFIDTVDP